MNQQLLPIIKTYIPFAWLDRVMQATIDAIEQSKQRQGLAFGGMLPTSGQVGIERITPREFNLASAWTFRVNQATTGWVTGAILSNVTLSKFTHLLIAAYENWEASPKIVAIKATAAGAQQPVVELAEIINPSAPGISHLQPIEPYVSTPISVYNLDAFVRDIGYDETRPWGFVVAPYVYLISTTFIA